MNTYRINKLEGGAAMRTHELVGVSPDAPEVGKCFSLVGKSLTEGSNLRLFNTSIIKSIEPEFEGEGLVLTTQSGSKYFVELVE